MILSKDRGPYILNAEIGLYVSKAYQSKNLFCRLLVYP